MLRVAQPQPDELRTDGTHFRTVEVRVRAVETAGVELVREAMDSLGTGAVVVTRRGVDAELFSATESGSTAGSPGGSHRLANRRSVRPDGRDRSSRTVR